MSTDEREHHGADVGGGRGALWCTAKFRTGWMLTKRTDMSWQKAQMEHFQEVNPCEVLNSLCN